ncbi:MAG: inositol monophosphatase family protein [Alphaproteobacteria bacterium]
MDRVPDELVAFAGTLADASGPVIRAYYDSGVTVEDKADSSPVTQADKEAEAAIRAVIERAYPAHGIVGEEYGATRADADLVWVLDPVDGTKAFIVHKLTFGTLIALSHRGKPVLGVIDQPVLGHRWVGAIGHPTTFNGAPVRVRACPQLAEARLNTTAADLFDAAQFARFLNIARAAKFCHWGGDCYGFGLVASGYIDLSVEAGLKTHDFMALVPIIEGAGGKVTDWAGRPLDMGSDGTIIAAGDPALVQQAVTALA